MIEFKSRRPDTEVKSRMSFFPPLHDESTDRRIGEVLRLGLKTERPRAINRGLLVLTEVQHVCILSRLVVDMLRSLGAVVASFCLIVGVCTGFIGFMILCFSPPDRWPEFALLFIVSLVPGGYGLSVFARLLLSKPPVAELPEPPENSN